MKKDIIGTENNIIFYEDENGNTNIEVVLKEENVWLNTYAISSLFNIDRTVITKHINNIYILIMRQSIDKLIPSKIL